MNARDFDENTRAELKYLMGYFGLSEMWIYSVNKIGNKELAGKIILKEGNLSYDYSRCFRYFTNEYTAYLNGAEQIRDYAELIKRFQSKEETSIVAVYSNEKDVWEYADKDGVVRHHGFPKKVKTEREEIFKGTLDDIFVQMDKANRGLRYCNGSSWRFKESEVRYEYLLWSKWIPESRSLDLYYGNGIVD